MSIHLDANIDDFSGKVSKVNFTLSIVEHFMDNFFGELPVILMPRAPIILDFDLIKSYVCY